MAGQDFRAGGPYPREVPAGYSPDGFTGDPPLRPDVAYHVTRSIEELDLAESCRDPESRRAHEHIASIHLAAACRLSRPDLLRVVAERVD